MATNGTFGQDQFKPEHYNATSLHSSEISSSSVNGTSSLEPSKDEVGWYFVEQYYTTLSRNPEKLHLFYGKRSQFVAGQEAEVAPIAIGRTAIQERIKNLDFEESKVRISNVDSQAAESYIVIQVIGEMSNKSADLKKFVQTFVLAKQPTGYFVLNDIFRFIDQDLEEEVKSASANEPVAPVATTEQAPEATEETESEETKEPGEGALDTDVVDKRLEEVLEVPTAATADDGEISSPAVEEAPEVAAPAASLDNAAEGSPSLTEVEKTVEEESIKVSEEPQDPTPTPVQVEAPVQPVKAVGPSTPAAPPKPMSWANRVAVAAAASVVPKAAVPVATKTGPAAPQPVARTAPTQGAPATQPQTTSPTSNKENENPQQSGWQNVGDNAKRQNRPQSVSLASPVEKEGTMAYLRNVTENVDTEDLRATLTKYGELVYFDINRQKNCAFVEFASPTGYQAAAAANPHVLGGESIIVEPRRPKSSAYGGAGYSGGRGGYNSNRGRAGSDNGRGNQRGRGSVVRGRGSSGTPPVTA